MPSQHEEPNNVKQSSPAPPHRRPHRRRGPACLNGALDLLADGLPPVVLHAPGDVLRRRDGTTVIATGKEPRLTNWASAAREADAPTLRRLWEDHPDSGVGVLLGLGEGGEPGIVDVEVDDEALAAPVLARIFGAGGPPETRRFRSNKGEHRFHSIDSRTAARLREIGIVQPVIKGEQQADGSVKGDPAYVGLEIRLGTLDPSDPKQLQTVCPPTPKADGTPRQWEGSEIAPFPEELLADLATHSRAAREHAARRNTGGSRSSPPPRPERDDLTPVELFAHQLQVMGLSVTPSGDGFSCQCPVPAHADRDPSMTFHEGRDGRLLVRCHGCSAEFKEIMEAVGLTESDAFPAGQRLSPGTSWRRNNSLPAPRREIDDVTADRLARLRDEYVAALAVFPEKLLELSRRLGVSEATLRAFDVGWREDWERDDNGLWIRTGRFAWIFPEVDGRGRVVGLLRRYEEESLGKRAVAGGRRGLILSRGWDAGDGPIILTEGFSDTAAVREVGWSAIGRPQAMARSILPDLVDLLQGNTRKLVVAADNDEAGRAGAIDLARSLERELGRDVLVMPPLPPGVNDLRERLTASGVDEEGRYVAR